MIEIERVNALTRSVSAPPVEAVLARGARIRRKRQQRRLAFVGTVAIVVAVCAGLAYPLTRTATSGVRALTGSSADASSYTNCDTEATLQDPSYAGELRVLPNGTPPDTGPLKYAWARQERRGRSSPTVGHQSLRKLRLTSAPSDLTLRSDPP